jgi:hypothetical protein
MSNKVSLITEEDGATEPELPPAQDLFRNFVAAINGEEDAVIPADDCYRMTEVTLKAREAADGGKIVAL